MGAARYIGRIGGLAVALGVGAAIATGAASASATPGTSDTSPSSSADRSSGAASADSASDRNARRTVAVAGGGHAAANDDGARGAAKISAGIRAAIKAGAAADGVPDNVHRRWAKKEHLGPGNSSADSRRAAIDAVDQPSITAALRSAGPESGGSVVGQSAIGAGVASVAADALPVSADAMQAKVDAPQSISVPRNRTVLAAVVSDAVNALAGGSPSVPIPDSPADWVLLAAARRDITTDAVSAGPTVEIADGIIHGSTGGLSSSALPLTYTVVGAPNSGGKVSLNTADGTFTFLPYKTVVGSGGTEQFTVLVAENTAFDQALAQLPLVGGFVPQILVVVHQIPVLNEVLAPLIGRAEVVAVNVDLGALAPAGTPVAYTVKVASFDGTPISVNYFPASGLQQDEQAPTILNGAGLAGAGSTDPYAQGGQGVGAVGTLREQGYNVVTWDSRGEHDSGGILQLDSPFYEGRDVSAIIDFVAEQPGAQLDAANDPRLGMTGGSYGGGIQLVAAGIDRRIDAIVPVIAWNSLNESLYPNGAFKTSYGALLLLSLVITGVDINTQLYGGTFTGALTGFLTEEQQALLAGSGPTALVNNIDVPTLLIQGTVDVLFPLRQAMENAEMLAANGTLVKTVWFCGGHGICDTPAGDGDEMVETATLSWLNAYVKHKGEGVDDGLPTFQWIDQNGEHYTSDLLPTDVDFQGDPITAQSSGGFLPIVPILGGSGPNLDLVPFSLGNGSKAQNAIDITVDSAAGTQIVGSPELTMTYSGIGTSRHVYAQIVDDQTGEVVGHLVTPISVTLDGKEHTVTVPLEALAYTVEPGHTVTVQITSAATPFLNLTEFGYINVSSAGVSLPTVGSGAHSQLVSALDAQLVNA